MKRGSPSLIFIAACVAALALRLVVPAGWMPVAGAGRLEITLCSGTVLPSDPAHPVGQVDQHCGFALALGPWLAAAALVLSLLLLPVLPTRLPMPAVRPAHRHRPRPLGQGPPTA